MSGGAGGDESVSFSDASLTIVELFAPLYTDKTAVVSAQEADLIGVIDIDSIASSVFKDSAVMWAQLTMEFSKAKNEAAGKLYLKKSLTMHQNLLAGNHLTYQTAQICLCMSKMVGLKRMIRFLTGLTKSSWRGV